MERGDRRRALRRDAPGASATIVAWPNDKLNFARAPRLPGHGLPPGELVSATSLADGGRPRFRNQSSGHTFASALDHFRLFPQFSGRPELALLCEHARSRPARCPDANAHVRFWGCRAYRALHRVARRPDDPPVLA